jgi:hypothetical protein
VGRDARALAADIAVDEPRTSHMVSDLLVYRERRWRRAWRIIGPTGDLAGALVLVRVCFDRWTAASYVRDAGAAPELARLLDRSFAWSVAGSAGDIRPLLPHLAARRMLVALWFIASHPVPDLLGPPDDHTRLATTLDIGPLVELYSGYEMSWPLTRWQLRQYLQRALDRHVVIVYETEGRLVGAVTIDSRSRRFLTMTDMTVRPDFRRSGIAWELTKRVREIAAGMAVGAWGASRLESHAHRRPRIAWGEERLQRLARRPRRFAGQTRLRRLYGRIQKLNPRIAANSRSHRPRSTAARELTSFSSENEKSGEPELVRLTHRDCWSVSYRRVDRADRCARACPRSTHEPRWPGIRKPWCSPTFRRTPK